MFSNDITTNIGRDSNNSILGNPIFLAHEHEPIDKYESFTPDEIKQELYQNRFFLKQRVWKNIRKMHRHPELHYHVSESELKVLKPHHN